jgi:hypothetical protein
MVVGFLSEAAWQSTPKRSKTIAAQRLSSTFASVNAPIASVFQFLHYRRRTTERHVGQR